MQCVRPQIKESLERVGLAVQPVLSSEQTDRNGDRWLLSGRLENEFTVYEMHKIDDISDRVFA